MGKHLSEILDRVSKQSAAVHAWHAEHGPTLAAISLKMLRSEQMGAAAAEAAAYGAQRMALLPSLDDRKRAALSFGPVELAREELVIARGAFVDADDAALQAILSYKAERDHGGVMVDDRRDRAIRYVHKRRAARAKVHQARGRLDELSACHGFRMGAAA